MDFAALGPEPFSVLSYHNDFMRQVRRAFVIGGHYPALVGCCALGERILNHLIHEFRDDFKPTPQYKVIYDKDSIDDWTKAIDVLEAWDILLPEVADQYRELKTKRHNAIHFQPETSVLARDMALEAIKLLGEIIQKQFGSLGGQPWYFGVPGQTYIKGDSEGLPFVRKILLPQGLLVGPRNRLDYDETLEPGPSVKSETMDPPQGVMRISSNCGTASPQAVSFRGADSKGLSGFVEPTIANAFSSVSEIGGSRQPGASNTSGILLADCDGRTRGRCEMIRTH